MIYILHYVTFDSATQTTRYEPRNFVQIYIFRQIWNHFQKKPSVHQELLIQLSFTVKVDKKICLKSQISRKLYNCALTLMACV